ncbi:MAG TPA: dienelactone hydrolase family protein [Terriglobales bacterium]|nr:dienelactone hydrolase family protein [Terriglobales bacterium]
MEYVLYLPPATQSPIPVLLLLHGAGDQVENFAGAWKSKAKKEEIALIAPQLPRDPTLEPHIPKILPCLVADVEKNRLPKNIALDSHRLYIFGYSMGGYLAYDAALLDSNYFGAAAIHAMGIADEYMPIVDRAQRKIPLAISIGERDQLVSLSQVRKTRDVLLKKGFTVDYKEIPGHTHNYYEMSDSINNDVWKFLSARKLP